METPKDQPERPARHRVEVKLSAEQKETIARGAAIAKQGISEFVRSTAERAARELISKNR